MKINTSSWHYNVMTAYKYGRLSDHIQSDMGYLTWSRQNTIGDRYGYKTFKAYVTETQRFLPMDFCSYWRAVILWPLIHILFWMLPVAYIVFTAMIVDISGILVGAGIAGGVILLFIAALFAVAGVEALFKKTMKVFSDSDGFFSEVKKSIDVPELCSIVEYTSNDKKDIPNE